MSEDNSNQDSVSPGENEEDKIIVRIPPKGPAIFDFTFFPRRLVEAWALDVYAGLDEFESQLTTDEAIAGYRSELIKRAEIAYNRKLSSEELEQVMAIPTEEIREKILDTVAKGTIHQAFLAVQQIKEHFEPLFSGLVELIIEAGAHSIRPRLYEKSSKHYKLLSSTEYKNLIDDFLLTIERAFPIKRQGGDNNRKSYLGSTDGLKFLGYYNEIFPIWQEAAEYEIGNRKFKHWQKEWPENLLRQYPQLNDDQISDLIEQLPNLQKEDARISELAAEHAARMCEVIPNKHKPTTLKKYLKRARAGISNNDIEIPDNED